MIRYELGCGCIKIARDLDLTFDSVFEIVRAEYPEGVRIGTHVTLI